MIGKNAGRRVGRVVSCGMAALAAGAIFAGAAGAAMEIDEYDFALSSYQAGGHPDADLSISVSTGSGEALERVTWISDPGFILAPESVPNCTSFSGCQPDSQVGVVTVRGEHEGDPSFLFGTAPVYQLTPSGSQYLRLGFTVPTINRQVEGGASLPIEAQLLGLNITSPYQMQFGFGPLPGDKPLTSIELELWGTPADPAHDAERFPSGSFGCPGSETTSCLSEPLASSAPELPFTLSAVYCPPKQSFVNWTPWISFQTYGGERDVKVTIGTHSSNCNLLGFSPTLTAAPTTTAGYSGSGLVLDVKDPQGEPDPNGLYASELQSASMTTHALVLDPALPEHPVCEDSAAAMTSSQPTACPGPSKVGTVDFKLAGHPQAILGEIFLGETVNEKIRVFVVGSEGGLDLKLVGTIEQLAAERLKFSFGAQPRLPIVEEKFTFEPSFVRTPVHCGKYVVEGSLVPWDPNHAAASLRPQYTIASGPNGSPCIGLPATVAVQLEPSSIPADGSSQTEATIAVRDADANRVPAEQVMLSSTDPDQQLGEVVDNGDGTYSVAITSSKTVGPSTITATDLSAGPNIAGSATLTQEPIAGMVPAAPPPPAVGQTTPPIPACVVPNLRGKRLGAARKRVAAAGCRLGRVKKRRGAIGKRGKVVGQRPKAGTQLAAGALIRVTIG